MFSNPKEKAIVLLYGDKICSHLVVDSDTLHNFILVINMLITNFLGQGYDIYIERGRNILLNEKTNISSLLRESYKINHKSGIFIIAFVMDLPLNIRIDSLDTIIEIILRPFNFWWDWPGHDYLGNLGAQSSTPETIRKTRQARCRHCNSFS